jgi:hypothetical protein
VQGASTNDSFANSSFLLDLGDQIVPTVGSKYRIEGLVEMTDGYADDNNRVGFYLFGDTAEVPDEDEEGAIGVIFNTDDGPDDEVSFLVGIDAGNIGPDIERDQTVPDAQDLFGDGTVGTGTDIKFVVDLVFTNTGSTNVIFVSGIMIDNGVNITTLPGITVPFDAYTGDFFGFVNRARNRNRVGDTGRSGDWVMNYKSFTVKYLKAGVIPIYTKFQQYLIAADITNEVDFVETNDFDEDGLQNLYEYGIGGDPNDDTDLGFAPVLVKAADGSLLFVTTQRTDDPQLTYTVETTTDLLSGSWGTAGTTVSGTNVVGATLAELTNSVDTVAQDQRFIRLSIDN